MDTAQAFARNQQAKAAGNRHRVFDWNKAAQILHDRKFDNPVQKAGAGLSGDWEYTGGDIYCDGKPVPQDDTYVYLASSWATPELSVDGELIDCWIYENDSDGWGPHTYWPESAVAILNG